MSGNKALIYPHKYDTILHDWDSRFKWIVKALRQKKYEVLVHEGLDIDLDCERVSASDCEKIHFDTCIFNHCDIGEVKEIPVDAEVKLFLKPTVPDTKQATLDELGYGSYSSITYEKPDFGGTPDHEVSEFFMGQVDSWIERNESKWGKNHFSQEGEIEEDDYYLVIGQCSGDSVVNRQDFGGYFEKIKKICKELSVIQDRDIIVKLHPYTNGKGSKKKEIGRDYESELKLELESYSPKIKVRTGFRSIHDFLYKARCVIVGNSGAGFEAMMHSKPIISFCYPEYHWITYDLRKTCDLHRAIEIENWFKPSLSDKFLCWYMKDYCIYDEDSTKRRIDDLLDYEDVYIRIR